MPIVQPKGDALSLSITDIFCQVLIALPLEARGQIETIGIDPHVKGRAIASKS